MFYIKRRIIDISLVKILSAPYLRNLSNNKKRCYFKAFVRIADNRSFENSLYDTSLYYIEVIAPCYTLPLWSSIYKTYKNQPRAEIDFLKLYGYPYKPNKDKIAFYVCEATQRKINPTSKREMIEGDISAYFSNRVNSYFEGEEYLKEKYPLLNEEKNKIKPLLYKDTTPNSIYHYKDITQSINSYLFNDNLYKLINPNQKKELEGKPIFYQLLDTLADTLSIAENIGRGLAIKVLLSGSTYRAKKPKKQKAQKPKEEGE